MDAFQHGNLQKAEKDLLVAVQDAEKFGELDPRLAASSLNGLAAVYYSQNRYADAESLYRRSLVIREKALGPEDYDVAQSLSNLALLYAAQKKYAEAELAYRRSLAILEKTVGVKHPEFAFTLINQALLYVAQERYAEAGPLYERSIAVLEEALGPEHPNLAEILESYSDVLSKTGRDDEAVQMRARAATIRAKTQ